MAGLLAALSQRYDRAVFGVPPPGDRASDVEVLLQVIVVIPELVAVLAVLVTTSSWRSRDVAVLAFHLCRGPRVYVGHCRARFARGRGQAMRGGRPRRRMS